MHYAYSLLNITYNWYVYLYKTFFLSLLGSIGVHVQMLNLFNTCIAKFLLHLNVLGILWYVWYFKIYLENRSVSKLTIMQYSFQKNGRDFDKLKNVLRPDEFSATLSSITEDQRHQYLESTFQENVETYRKVIDRLATH